MRTTAQACMCCGPGRYDRAAACVSCALLESRIDWHAIADRKPVRFVSHSDDRLQFTEHLVGHAGATRRRRVARDAIAAVVRHADRYRSEVGNCLALRQNRERLKERDTPPIPCPTFLLNSEPWHKWRLASNSIVRNPIARTRPHHQRKHFDRICRTGRFPSMIFLQSRSTAQGISYSQTAQNKRFYRVPSN
ncbi:hypothetical protein OKW50_004501 [Paraburkholderia youngii]